MLVLPYNWNIEYQKKKFISKIAWTKLIMKRYLPTHIPLHTIRHTRLWHSLSFHFDLLLEPWESPVTATKLCAFDLLQSSFSMLFRVSLVLRYKTWTKEDWPLPKLTYKLPLFTLTSWAMKDVYPLLSCFSISYRSTHDQDNFCILISQKYFRE